VPEPTSLPVKRTLNMIKYTNIIVFNVERDYWSMLLMGGGTTKRPMESGGRATGARLIGEAVAA